MDNNVITIVGPRLQDLAGFDNKDVNNAICQLIVKTLEKHPKSTLLTSANTGIEMWAAEAALQLNMPIELVIPCDNFQSKWPAAIRKIYDNIYQEASNRKVLSSEPWSGKLMFAKEKYMCEQANLIYHFYSVPPRFMVGANCFGLLKDITCGYFIEL